MALRRDRGLDAQVADVFAKGVAGVPPIGDDPSRHPRQPVKQRHRVRQLMGLPRSQHEGYGAAEAVGEDTGLGSKVATRAAKRLTMVSLCWSIAFLATPAAFWWARMFVPPRKVMPSCRPRSWTRASRRSYTPSRDQRMKVCAAIHQGPCSAGSARHLAPLSWRHRIAPMVRRRCRGGTLAWGGTPRSEARALSTAQR